MNDSRRKEIADFTSPLHHRSSACKRRTEGLKGKNTLALEMVEHALEQGIDADYLLIDSWHPKGTAVGRMPNPISSGKAITTTYKKRWNIKQGYKDLREHFGLGKEENRIYEALVAKITLSMFTYN